MGQRVGGVLKLTIDGTQFPARGNFQVSASNVKREGIAGQDGVHGYTEAPIVPGIKGDFTTTKEVSLTALLAITNSTITAEMANGKTYVLTEAWTKGAFEIDSAEGKFSAEFEGVTCEEI